MNEDDNLDLRVREALAVGLAARDKFLVEEDCNDQIGAFNTGALAFARALGVDL